MLLHLATTLLKAFFPALQEAEILAIGVPKWRQLHTVTMSTDSDPIICYKKVAKM